MCGIVGYIGDGKIGEILLKCLRKLEYRGYDSCGVAVLDGNITVKKDVGKIDEVNKKLNFADLQGKAGIAHTRWATHGEVSKANAHPHVDCKGDIAIVHNGIIENYQELRKKLETLGHNFRSDTDTEILAHLIEEYAKHDDFFTAVKKALQEVEGSYAIAVLKRGENRLIAARRGSPLVIGVARNGYFVASDIPAFLEHTKSVIYLYDGDIVSLDDVIKIHNLQHGEVKRFVDTVDWTSEEIDKKGFRYYMLKEILEQTETLKRASQQDKEIIQQIADEINKAYGVFLLGCGSSYHACLVGSYLFSKIAKKHINVVLASEFPNYEHFLTEKTLVIAVSQSGETADVLEAVKVAKRKNAKIISIVNVRGSSLDREAHHSLLLNAGPEICVLSTKTYTSQIALLLLLARACAGEYEKAQQELNYAWNLAFNLTSRSMREHITNLAEKLKDANHIFTIGRDMQFPTALEAALKIKEVSYIHAEGFAAGELKHGSIALIEKGTPCIVFVSKKVSKETVSNAAEIKARGGYLIGVGPEPNDIFDFYIKVPEVGNINPICQIIPIQLLAYKLAVLRGYDPDKPRNLAKSVTVK